MHAAAGDGFGDVLVLVLGEYACVSDGGSVLKSAALDCEWCSDWG